MGGKGEGRERGRRSGGRWARPDDGRAHASDVCLDALLRRAVGWSKDRACEYEDSSAADAREWTPTRISKVVESTQLRRYVYVRLEAMPKGKPKDRVTNLHAEV